MFDPKDAPSEPPEPIAPPLVVPDRSHERREWIIIAVLLLAVIAAIVLNAS